MTNAHWGVWPNMADEQTVSSGGMCAPSSNQGDGEFCPECREKGFFNWIEYNSSCEYHDYSYPIDKGREAVLKYLALRYPKK